MPVSDTLLNKGQPPVPVIHLRTNHFEKGLLNLPGNQPALPAADLHLIDCADRRNFSRCSGEKDLIGYIEKFARNTALLDMHAEITD